MSTFSEQHKIARLYGPTADGFNGNPATPCFSFVDYSHATVILQIGPTVGAGVGKVQVEKCTDATGAGNTAMDFRYRKAVGAAVGDAIDALATAVAATGFTTAVSADDLYVIEIDGRELGEGYTAARLQFTENVNDPKDVGVTVIMSGARYRGGVGVMPSCLS